MSKLKSRLLALALGLAVSMAPGCGTLAQARQQKGPALFGGIRLLVAEFGYEESTAGDKVFYCIDMPSSLGGDVCILLFSGINEIYEIVVHGRIHVDPQRPSSLHQPLYLR